MDVKINVGKEENQIQEGRIIKERKRMAGSGFLNKISKAIPARKEAGLGDGAEAIGLRVSKWSLYLFFLLAPVFFFPLTISPVMLSKQMLVIALLLVGLVGWLSNIISMGKILYSKTPLNIAVIAYFAVTALAVFFSKVPILGLKGVETEPDVLMNVAIFSLAFFLIGTVLNKKNDLKKAVYFFIGSFAILAVMESMQLMGIYIFPWAYAKAVQFNPIGAPQALGIFLSVGVLLLASVLPVMNAKRNVRLALWILGAVLFIDLYFLKSFYAWLALMIAMIIVISYIFSMRTGVVIKGLNIPLTILVAAVLLLFIKAPPLAGQVKFPREVSINNFSKGASFAIAKKTLRESGWLLGSGPGTYPYSYSAYKSQELNSTPFWSLRFNESSSRFLTNMATTGLFGILAIFGVMALFLFYGFRVFIDKTRDTFRSRVVLFGVSGGIAMFVLWFMYPMNFTLVLFTFVLMGLAVAGASDTDDKTRQFSLLQSPQRNLALSLISIVLIVISFGALFLSGQRYVAAYYYEKGIKAFQRDQDIDTAINNLSRAIRTDGDDDKYRRSLTQVLLIKAKQILDNKDMSLDTRKQQLQIVLSSITTTVNESVKKNPEESMNWMIRAKAYTNLIPVLRGREADMEKEALRSLDRAGELDPFNPLIPLEKARVYVVMSDLTQLAINRIKQEGGGDKDQEKKLNDLKNERIGKAFDALENAIELKQDYAEANFLMAQLYDRKGETEKAQEKLKIISRDRPNDVGVAFQLGILYFKGSKLNEAQREFERALSISPQYSNAMYFLGLVYDKKGDKENAIKQFEAIELLNPDNEEIKKILANLKAGRSALERIVPPAQPPEEREKPPVEGVVTQDAALPVQEGGDVPQLPNNE